MVKGSIHWNCNNFFLFIKVIQNFTNTYWDILQILYIWHIFYFNYIYICQYIYQWFLAELYSTPQQWLFSKNQDWLPFSLGIQFPPGVGTGIPKSIGFKSGLFGRALVIKAISKNTLTASFFNVSCAFHCSNQ